MKCCYKMIFAFFFLILSIKVDDTYSLKLIDIEANMKKMEVINLSQFTDNIHYVPLENKENLPLSYITYMDFSKDNILVADRNFCLLYDIYGRFVSKIGNKGRGPGEYSYLTNICIGKNGKIYLSDTENLYEYNNDGSFVKKYIKSLLLNDTYYLTSWFQISDSLFLGHVPNSSGLIDYKAILINKFGDIKHYYKNYNLFNRKIIVASTTDNYANVYKFKNEIFYKELYNDTLFCLTDQYELIPKYVFNLGKYKESDFERQIFNLDHISNCIQVYDAFQTERYLFLNCDFADYFPAKRLTPKPTPISFSKPIWYNTRRVLGIFDKKAGHLVFCKPTTTDNPLFTSGVYNDIDAGPRFFPKKQINDSTMVMLINAEELKDHVESYEFKNSVPKYSEKKKKLEDLAKNLSEFDNPILMFVNFKGK